MILPAHPEDCECADCVPCDCGTCSMCALRHPWLCICAECRRRFIDANLERWIDEDRERRDDR